MSECCIKFPEPVSRGTISQLVIEYMKYILYYRGQFPLPLDQLILSIEESDKSAQPAEVDKQPIYYDQNPKPNLSKDRTKRLFEDAISTFDKFFTHLSALLSSQDVLEVVLNLGPNMMSPKELHRITLPPMSNCPSCLQKSQDSAPFHRCRLLFFKAIMHGDLLSNFCASDSILPISVMLCLRTGTQITELMEQKRFYAPPKRGRQVTVKLDDNCSHSPLVVEDSMEGVWVKLKPDLKGFKAHRSFSSCAS